MLDKMAAPKGHPMWGNPLKPKKYTPEQLWNGALKYFEWCDKHPVIVVEQSKMPQRLTAPMTEKLQPKQIKAFLKQTVGLPHQRAYTLEGLCRYMNITRETFDNYSKTLGYESYFDTTRAIREIIDNQHLVGGMAGTLNANIVIRKLGLADKIQNSMRLEILPNSKEEEDELKKAANAPD